MNIQTNVKIKKPVATTTQGLQIIRASALPSGRSRRHQHESPCRKLRSRRSTRAAG